MTRDIIIKYVVLILDDYVVLTKNNEYIDFFFNIT